MINNIGFFTQFFPEGKKNILGITGNCGSGKTFLSNELNKRLNVNIYSTDYRFIGKTKERAELLKNKSKNIDDYIDYANQLSWWNWNLIEKEIRGIHRKEIDHLVNVYDRDTGSDNFGKIIIDSPNLIVEGAIFSDITMTLCDKIIYLYVDEEIRFNRLLEKDRSRRTFKEILSRFLITSYSEDIFLKKLLSRYQDKLIILNDSYFVMNFSKTNYQNFIPLEITV